MSKHTPTPWIMHSFAAGNIVADNPGGRLIANMNGYQSTIEVHNENIANAEFVLTACNYHERLKETLKELAYANGPDDWFEKTSNAQQILKELEEQK